jgi:hypothetical protein
MLEQFKDYYNKAKMNQERLYQNYNWTKEDINDDLIWHVPIYDVVNRRYAAFSSLPEAIWNKEDDVKGNGKYFKAASISKEDFAYMCYLFRLCGSGINYIPKTNHPWGSHGFGNFWIIDLIRRGYYRSYIWIDEMMVPDKGFCDVKGYLLPMIKEGLRSFIIYESKYLFDFLWDIIINNSCSIKYVVDTGNDWLIKNKYRRQNFVLSAFAMDMAEYFPNNVDRNSDVYAGTNAKKCLKMILPEMKTDEALRYLCNITGNHSKPYDMEDVACDFIRYIENFQSEDHIKFNNGIKYYNNVCK